MTVLSGAELFTTDGQIRTISLFFNDHLTLGINTKLRAKTTSSTQKKGREMGDPIKKSDGKTRYTHPQRKEHT